MYVLHLVQGNCAMYPIARVQQRVCSHSLLFGQGGQAQRVTLAISLALKPDFLLLDGEKLQELL